MNFSIGLIGSNAMRHDFHLILSHLIMNQRKFALLQTQLSDSSFNSHFFNPTILALRCRIFINHTWIRCQQQFKNLAWIWCKFMALMISIINAELGGTRKIQIHFTKSDRPWKKQQRQTHGIVSKMLLTIVAATLSRTIRNCRENITTGFLIKFSHWNTFQLCNFDPGEIKHDDTNELPPQN